MARPFPSCYLNGDYLPLAEARISPLDRGFLFADGVYEVVPVHRGRPFRLREHLVRLDRSAAALRMTQPLDHVQWQQVVETLGAQDGTRESLVYMQITRGAEFGRNHPFPDPAIAPTVFAFASPFVPPSPQVLEQGLAAATLDDIRWSRCDIKSVALLANVLLRQEAQDRGSSEALLLRDGRLMEGSSSTVFVVSGGRLATPPNDHRILPGTSRDAVLELAAGWLPADVRSIAADELQRCEEVWIASAGRGVLPVTRIDGHPVGSGRPGPLWRAMYARLQDHLDRIAATPALE